MDWADPNARALAIYLDGHDDPVWAQDGMPDDDFLVLVNSWWEPLNFTLPHPARRQWHVEIDSYDAAPEGAAYATLVIR